MCVTLITPSGQEYWSGAELVSLGYEFLSDELFLDSKTYDACFCCLDVEKLLDRYNIPWHMDESQLFIQLEQELSHA